MSRLPFPAATQRAEGIFLVSRRATVSVGEERVGHALEHADGDVEAVPLAIALEVAYLGIRVVAVGERAVAQRELGSANPNGVGVMHRHVVVFHGEMQVIAIVEHGIVQSRGRLVAEPRPTCRPHRQVDVGLCVAKRVVAC